MENKGVKKVAFVAANESDPLSQRDGGVAAAKALGLEVVAEKDTYQNDTRDFTPVLTPIIALKPDLLVLSGVAPANAPLLIRSARELGYEGLISTETAQDAKVLEEGAGELANGFHFGRWRIHSGNRIRQNESVCRALHQDVWRIQRRVQHQGLCTRLYS